MTDEPEIPLLRPSDLSGDHVPDEIRMKIGELINRWAYIEYQLKVIIRVSLGMTRAAQNVLLSGRDLRNLCELVDQIARAGDLWIPQASLRDELKSVAKAIAQGAPVRNEYAHGVFAVPRKGPQAGKFSRLRYQDLERKLAPDWHVTYLADFPPLLRKASRLGAQLQNATVKLKEQKKRKV